MTKMICPRYLFEALDFIRNHSEYIYLFQIYNDVEAMRNQEM